MKVIVTGGAGFIGSRLAENLSDQGHEVSVIDSFSDYYSPRLKRKNAKEIEFRGGKIIEADLARDPIDHFFKDVHFVYHLAAQPGISANVTLEEYIKDNIVATHRTLEALRQVSSLRALFYISTSSVYGAVATGDENVLPRPASYYGTTKLAAENLVFMYKQQYKIPVCVFRIFSVYGERERPEKLFPRLIRSILEKKEFSLYQGSERHRRSFTYVGDIVEGLIRGMARANDCFGKVINLGNEISVSTKEAIETTEEIIGRKATIIKKPPRPGDQQETRAVITRARKILDYSPETPLKEGLRREVEWFIKNR